MADTQDTPQSQTAASGERNVAISVAQAVAETVQAIQDVGRWWP